MRAHEHRAQTAHAGDPALGARVPSGPIDLEQAATVLAADGLVAFPTETVWGIAARASSGAAVARLRAWKGSEARKPFSVLISGVARLDALAPDLCPAARDLALRCWPGPLTLIVRCGVVLAPGVSGADGATGFRCSPHPVAGALARLSEQRGLGPLTATSLNRTGEAPAATRGAAESILRGSEGPALLLGDEAGGEAPSTVVDATGHELRVVREGAIPRSVLGIEGSPGTRSERVVSPERAQAGVEIE